MIKKAHSNEFYLGYRQWTTDRDSAMSFNNSIEALQECAKNGLPSEIVLSFRDHRHDVKIPCGMEKKDN